MLSVRGLSKSYGSLQALTGIDLDIPAGTILALLGPNGAGKTTLVSLVVGLRRPDAGSITVNGVDAVARPHEARRFIGYAPQEMSVYPTLTVRENLLYCGELAELRGAELSRRIVSVAEALALTDMLDRKVRELSGGEKRRVHTGMALLHNPPLLLLDEPTTGVDVRTRAQVLDVVRSLAEQGSAVCYSTHYLGEVEALGAEVAIIDRGQLIARDGLKDLIAAHGRPVLELAFDGPPPSLDLNHPVEVAGEVGRVFSDDPAATAATALTALGPEASRLVSIEIIRPSLEGVFLGLTGRRYDSGEDEADDEVVDVVSA